MSESSHIIYNGDLIQEPDLRISPINRGLMYGDGCFETLRSYGGKFLGWKHHFQRLLAGLDYLEMDAPFSSMELKSQVHRVLQQNNLAKREAMIRIQCWREGGRGYAASSREINWIIQSNVIHPQKVPLKLVLAGTRCIPFAALDRKYKLSNGLNYIKAAQEAKKAQCDDALMLTINKKVSETTSANIFWIKDGKVYTPSEDCDLLPGVTRQLLMQIINETGIDAVEGEFEWKDVQNAEVVFCTNSLIEILEVETIAPTQSERKTNGELRFNIKHLVLQQVKRGFQEFKKQELSA